MNKTHILPVIMICLNLGAAGVYGCAGDWKKMVYWIAAAILTVTVTF